MARYRAGLVYAGRREPDMANPRIYELICAQIDELLEHTPQLTDSQVWIREGADMPLSRLKYQSLPIEEIVERIVETVHAKYCSAWLAV